MQGCQHFGAKRFREHGPSRAFVHEAIRRDGHDQHIAKAPGGFQMPNMSKMQEIKRAMRLNNSAAARAKFSRPGCELGERQYL
jgi:hypothetical protein